VLAPPLGKDLGSKIWFLALLPYNFAVTKIQKLINLILFIMKKLFFVAIAFVALVCVSCENTIFPGKIEDKPFIEFYDESVTVDADGGEMVIPVLSTGVDNVNISFSYFDRWEVDPESGDLTPEEGWIKLVKVIDQYDVPTRALAKWDSGICVVVEPNTTGYERKAKITVQSITLTDTIEVIQSAGSVASEE
jgi:hypothetical protein